MRNPEVPDLRPAIGRQQDVLRLDVAMHDPFGVGRGQPVAHVRGDAHGVIHRQAAALVQQRAQAAA